MKKTQAYRGPEPHRLVLLLACSTVMLVTGCASEPDPLEISSKEVIEATVTAIDQSSRLVKLRGPRGNEIVMMAGPEVRNLEQVKVGDTLRVTYYSAMIASLANDSGSVSDMTLSAARAEEGARPGAAVGATVTDTVEIVAVADEGRLVTFRDVSGFLRSIDVQREESRAFARKLSPGDLVQIEYVEAVAIELEGAD